jgi:hypothetical protein
VGGNDIRTISSIAGEDVVIRNPVQNDQVLFNCGHSQDESNVSQLEFSIDRDYHPDAPNFVPFTSGDQLNVDAASVGRFNMAIKARDPQGLEKVKAFTLVVECQNAPTPVLDISRVHVTPTAKLNYFNYSVDAGAVSGGTTFQYAWDFNGDQEYDVYSLTNPNGIWTPSASLSNIYTPFVSTGPSDTRKIGLLVKNECEKQSNYQIDVAFDPQTNIARNPASLSVVKPYYYLQSDISSAADPQNQRENAHLLVTRYPGDLKRVDCDYIRDESTNKAVFTITGYNWYKSQDDTTFIQGQKISIGNIADSGASSFSVSSSNNTAKLNTATFRVSEQDDGFVSENFSKSSTCPVALRISRAMGTVPCDDGSSVQSETITILGEYSCPQLTEDSNGRTIAVDNGKIFCEVAKADECVGGGGGGGGNPPPEE